MTPTDVQTLVDAAPLPPGYTMTVTPQRKYAYRNLWDGRVFKDGVRVFGRAAYNPAALIRMCQQWAWDRVPLTVTTDADGFITSMEPTE